MKKYLLGILLIPLVLLNSCNNDRLAVDVSHINLDLDVKRFDMAFLPIDTLNSEKTINTLVSEFGSFTNFFLDTVLQAGGIKNKNVLKELKIDPFYDVVMQVQEGINSMEQDVAIQSSLLEEGFKHLKFYFPEAHLPEVIMYNSWFQYGTLSYSDYLGVGLEFFIPDTNLHRLYPPQFHKYIKRDMKTEHIAVNAMFAHLTNVVYPTSGEESTLLDHMIYKGKVKYLLEAMFPDQKEQIIMNYSVQELEWCYTKQLAVWREITRVNEETNIPPLYIEKKTDINKWVNPGPFTAALSENATDRMGEWIGLQIIRDFMKENKDVSVLEMLDKNPRQLIKFYNPKN